jgi:hypothetical protein
MCVHVFVCNGGMEESEMMLWEGPQMIARALKTGRKANLLQQVLVNIPKGQLIAVSQRMTYNKS